MRAAPQPTRSSPPAAVSAPASVRARAAALPAGCASPPRTSTLWISVKPVPADIAPSVEPCTPTAAIAARSASDSNHSSVSSSVDIDSERITRNMSRPPSRRSFHASFASGPSGVEADLRQPRHRRAVRGIEDRYRALEERDEVGPARGVALGELADRRERLGVASRHRQREALAAGQQRDVPRGSARRIG
jgi:hypothetical protein